MSYLKLDRTKINYIVPNITRGGIILSQVIDSEYGPETPKLISSIEELDIYFGRSFKEREYFEELLSGDVTLLLTNPYVEEEIPVIDVSGWKVVDKIKAPDTDIEISLQHYTQLPAEGEDEVKYYIEDEKEYFIYVKEDGIGEWIKVSDIPLKKNPKLLSNRDTLRLTKRGWRGDEGLKVDNVWDENELPWCWPKYSSLTITPEYTETPNIDSVINSLEGGTLGDEEKFLGFILDFSKVPSSGMGKKEDENWTYLVIPAPGNRKIQFHIGDSLPPDIFHTEDNEGNNVKIPESVSLDEQINLIITSLRGNGWTCEKADETGLVWKMYSGVFLPDLKFYNIPGIEFKGDIETTHNILSIVSSRHKRMEFFSKTIGSGDEKIKVEISKLQGKTEWYRIIVSRYDNQEIFEGPLYLELDEETNTFRSLEKTINQYSSLVSCKIYHEWSYLEEDERGSVKEISVPYSKENQEDGLPTGEFTLSRAISQSPWSPEDYWRGLEKLLEFGVSEDFLMIPRIEDYLKTGVRCDESWYSEYKDFHEYATSKNCQVLVSNHPYYFGCETYDTFDSPTIGRPDSPKENHLYLVDGVSAEIWDGERWTVISREGEDRWKEITETLSPGYTGNQIFNYLIKNENGDVVKDLDPDNRLVYFYQDMTYLGWTRPAWYVFLKGVLSGEYSIEVNDIVYDSPSKYYTEDEVKLEECKSNFLSDNGHIYYYRRFFSHPGDWKYTTSILSRFCMDKVSNTVSRDFPAYLAKETTGEIIRGLQNILTNLKSRYPIIYSLDIDYIEEDTYNQKLSVYLNLGIRETLDKDVKLSVTLNFNFT